MSNQLKQTKKNKYSNTFPDYSLFNHQKIKFLLHRDKFHNNNLLQISYDVYLLFFVNLMLSTPLSLYFQMPIYSYNNVILFLRIYLFFLILHSDYIILLLYYNLKLKI